MADDKEIQVIQDFTPSEKFLILQDVATITGTIEGGLSVDEACVVADFRAANVKQLKDKLKLVGTKDSLDKDLYALTKYQSELEDEIGNLKPALISQHGLNRREIKIISDIVYTDKSMNNIANEHGLTRPSLYRLLERDNVKAAVAEAMEDFKVTNDAIKHNLRNMGFNMVQSMATNDFFGMEDRDKISFLKVLFTVTDGSVQKKEVITNISQTNVNTNSLNFVNESFMQDLKEKLGHGEVIDLDVA